uniref:Non-canonical purine NTP phosphatase/PRRC1 domain-containing protein n=1 Tax=Culex tarsalis TaxID=7177 RepID=A0A1Q3FD05_CULTA
MADQKKAGNILSNISPPSELPSFITAATAGQPAAASQQPSSSDQEDSPRKGNETDPFIPTTFSPAIPSSKDTTRPCDSSKQGPPPEQAPPAAAAAANASGSETKTSRDFANMILNPEPLAEALSPITQSGSALFGWMKGAVSSNGILQKVAEKAKSSVDTIVTTLDPQMKEYINSGGDTEVIVASDKDDKVRPIREAFQTVFGKATVIGLSAQATAIAAQPVGFAAGLKGAEHRINSIRAENPRVDDHLPVVAVQNFLVELFPDQWFEASVIVLFDYAKSILLKTVTQMTPIPLPVVASIRADTPADYQLKDTGFATTIGSVMAKNLNVSHTEWHKAYTSVGRAEMILGGAKTIATLYRQAVAEYFCSVEAGASSAVAGATVQLPPSE